MVDSHPFFCYILVRGNVMGIFKHLEKIPMLMASFILAIPAVIGLLFECIPLAVFGILIYKTRD